MDVDKKCPQRETEAGEEEGDERLMLFCHVELRVFWR